jgi:hypothetical protein
MNCPRFETLLTDYMDGALDPRVRSAMEFHLQECPACGALLQQVTQLRRELEEFPEIRVPEDLVRRILERTSGLPQRYSWWKDVVLATLRPFMTQRYAFATLVMFAFISFAVNVMGPTFSAAGSSLLNPSTLVARADELTGELYKRWREFSDFKARVSEEIRLMREDLIGRLDYHLVAILFASYDDTVREQQEQPQQTDQGRDRQPQTTGSESASPEEESQDE